MTKLMDTDSFTFALKRFIARCREVKTICCDNGSNFVGVARELAKCIGEMDLQNISQYLPERRTVDFVEIKSSYGKPHGWSVGNADSISQDLTFIPDEDPWCNPG